MAWLRTIAAELLGLFVDDAGFAVAILAWLAVTWFARSALPPLWSSVILFAGLAAILIESVVRRSRR
jgi:hypothetical protein